MNPHNRIQQLEAWIKEDPQDPFLPYAIALEWQIQGEIEQALNRLHQVCNAHPNYLPAFQLRGVILMEQNRLEEAQVFLEKAKVLAKNADDKKAIQEISELLIQINQEDE